MLPREGHFIFVLGQDGWVQAAFCIPGARWHRRVRAVPGSLAPREHAGALVVALPCRKISWAGLSLPADVCLCLSEGRRGWRELCLLALGQGELVEQA